MKATAILVIVFCLASASGRAQNSFWDKARSNTKAKLAHMPSIDSMLRRAEHTVTTKAEETKTQVMETAKARREEKKARVMHVGWEDGKVWEFQNAYTISKHEWRLNLLGPSSFGASDRLEIKSYLTLAVTPNISFKYRFWDEGKFSAAIEPGAAVGGLPVAAGVGLLMPGGALGGGTLGLVSFSDVFLKFYTSWHPTKELTFSVRAGASHIKASYNGLGGFAAIGGGGAGAGFFPLSVGIIKTNWLMAGFEADYVWNQYNAIVLRSSIGKLYTTGIAGMDVNHMSDNYLMMPSLSWNHAWRHVHLTAGIYNFFDPPSFEMTHASKLPVAPFADVYWVLNNRKREPKHSSF